MTIAVVAPDDVTPPIAAYARRLHGAVGGGHHVASPLGAWILLALCAPASEGRRRDALRAVLGLDVERATEIAATLLSTPQPVVSAAAAVWNRPGMPAEGLAPWLARLPASVDRGELPSQAALDAWARKHTSGLIDRFPQEVAPLTAFLLATAVATRVTWQEPFATVPSRELDPNGRWDWPRRVERALRSPYHPSHFGFIAATAHAGDVAVHCATARGLNVTSVIAGRDVPPADVIDAAYALASEIVRGRPVEHRSLFDLPLGDSALWSIEEREATTTTESGREERCVAVLPAWSAEASHVLREEDLGFPAAADTLAALAGIDEHEYTAVQSVAARYSRTGFEAAAISSMLVGAAMPLHRRRGLVRVATLRFGHPYAVVATAVDQPRWDQSARSVRYGPWHGVPVFSAWVAEPSEAEQESPTADEEWAAPDFGGGEWNDVEASGPAPPLPDATRAPASEPPRSRVLDWLRRFRPKG